MDFEPSPSRTTIGRGIQSPKNSQKHEFHKAHCTNDDFLAAKILKIVLPYKFFKVKFIFPTRKPHLLLLSVPPPHIVTDGGVFAYGLARGSTHRRQVPPLSVTATTRARRQEKMPDKSPRATYPSAHLRSIDKSVLEEEPRDRYSRKPCIAVG